MTNRLSRVRGSCAPPSHCRHAGLLPVLGSCWQQCRPRMEPPPLQLQFVQPKQHALPAPALPTKSSGSAGAQLISTLACRSERQLQVPPEAPRTPQAKRPLAILDTPRPMSICETPVAGTEEASSPKGKIAELPEAAEKESKSVKDLVGRVMAARKTLREERAEA